MSKRMTKAQREWCKNYEEATTFDPLMDDFKAGNESFVDAAHKSNKWFENWANDAYLSISRHIPGEYE
jgi:hypothetical protein